MEREYDENYYKFGDTPENTLNRKVLEVAKELKLNIWEFKGVFTNIFKEWGGYIDDLLKEGFSKICKTPQDFQRASETLHPLFESIYGRKDGSANFLTVLEKEISEGRITTMDQLIDTAQKLAQKNKDYWSEDENPDKRRGGGQFNQYIIQIRGVIENRVGDRIGDK